MASLTQRPVAPIRAPRGTALSCKGWPQEAALRMLMNNLDPDVAERWEDLVVYGGSGKAARSWEAYHAIVRTLRRLEDDETLLVQSGKPVGVFRTHPDAPRVLIANALLVPEWGDWEHFRQYEAMGLTMYGQMTAGSWVYIGTQGILQGTYEAFRARPPRSSIRRGDRSNRRPRRAHRICASGTVGGGCERVARARPEDIFETGVRVDRRPDAGDARVPAGGRGPLRLRQQLPARGRERGCLRLQLSRLRSRVHPSALLRGAGPVPLGGARG